jgi:signal transduction histidine kinase
MHSTMPHRIEVLLKPYKHPFVIALCILSCAWAQSPRQDAEQQHSTLLTQAHILLTDSDVIPPDSAAWQTQTLPDNWNRTRPGVGGFAWYRIRFDLLPDQLKLCALYVPRLSMTGIAFINGEPIGGDARFDEPMSRQWYRPQLFAVPAKLLKPGENIINIRIKTYVNNKGGLSELHFGSSELIQTKWRNRYFWQITSVQMTSAVTLGLSALALIAWSLRGWSSAYGFFGAAAMLWGLRNTHFFFTSIPISAFYWEILVATSLVWVLILIFMFVLRFTNQRFPIIERLVWGFAIATPFLIWAAGTLKLTFAIGLCYTVVLLLGAYTLKLEFDVARRERSIGPILLFVASVLVYAMGFHDWVTQRDILGFSEPYNLHFGAPIFFTALAFNMFQRFRDAQTQATYLAQTLESRIQQKNVELQDSYESLRAAKEKQAAAQERSRIMQDMHDGLGSQLVSSLAMAQSGTLSAAQTSELLRSCIDDLRLAIDTSNESRDSLALALGNLRFRMEPRLKAAGIALQWNIQKLREDLPLPPEHQLPVLRIIQESITNTLKHANATTLSVTVASSTRKLMIDISDDGQGFDMDAAKRKASGKGMNSLNKRARMRGAQLDITSTAKGTHTVLVVPLGENSVSP